MKLGYAEETIRLYYPRTSLNAIWETAYKDEPALLAALKETFADTGASPLGTLQFAIHGGRIEVSIPPEGVAYVHKHVADPPFLKDMIELFASHHACGPEEIKDVFAKYSTEYVCEAMPENADFDYVMYFLDASIDEYYYCVKQEMGHTVYHRFMKEDYLLL